MSSQPYQVTPLLCPMPDIQNPFSAGFTRRHAIVTAAGLFTLIALITFLKGVPSSSSTSFSRYPAGWQDRDPAPLGELDSWADNLHLTQSQCQVLFPRLYQEADRAAEWTLRRGGVTLADLDAAEEKGSARLLIWRNKVSIVAACRCDAQIMARIDDTLADNSVCTRSTRSRSR